MGQTLTFPKGFTWGAATSAYQIEGSVHADGRGESIWDVFSHIPGKTKNGDTGDIAADHYHHWKEDIALLKTLGIRSYRFSTAWPRILPQGTGQVNEAGLTFYDRLVDELLANSIEPVACLFHWDLPTALPGGWLARGTAEAFAAYTDVVTRKLGDRVKKWATLNEPFCAAVLGYALGEHAPGDTDYGHAMAAAHHLLLAHGLSVPIIRANVSGASVGQMVNPSIVHPATDSDADRFAAAFQDGLLNRWFLDPIFGKGYPAEMLAGFTAMSITGDTSNLIRPGDLDIIAAPIDFLGVNYYNRTVVSAVPGHEFKPGAAEYVTPPGASLTDIGWEIYPHGIYELLEKLYKTYKPKHIFVAENGAAFSDGPSPDGCVHDDRRVEYMRQHLVQVAQAIADGIPVEGYYAWSLLDNFEWAEGYTQRFGLVHVDYTTQQRMIKDSGRFYQQVIASNAVEE